MAEWADLEITNTYELYEDVITHVRHAEIQPLTGCEQEWAEDNLFEHTGAGHTDGDSWYDVKITDSSIPDLIGRIFYFGY